MIAINNLNKILYSFVIITTVFACSSVKEIDNDWARNRNVCKKLTGNVLVYTIFVSDKKNYPWEPAEIKEYMDSLDVACNWMEEQANNNNISLSISTVKHTKTSLKGPPGKSNEGAMKMLQSLSGLTKVNKHYDGICKKMKTSFIKQKSALKPVVKKIKGKETFTAMLRNQYQSESVVLIFAHKKDKGGHIAFSLNTLNNSDIEYLVNSFNNPSMISYQVLELFGAASLRHANNPRKQNKIAEHVKLHFKDDIMANPMASRIEDTNIGDFTQYLIGWKNEYDPKHKILMKGKRVRVK